MRGMINVLVTASGGDIGQGIIKSLKLSSYKNQIKIITTDINAEAAGLFLGNKGYVVAPANVNREKYLRHITAICKQNKTDIVFIGNEYEQFAIASSRDKLSRQVSTYFVVQPLKTIEICRDKLKICSILTKAGIRYPATCLGAEIAKKLISKFGYPIILKPRRGYGGVSKTHIVNNASELRRYHPAGTAMIAQEYIANKDGEEYTVGTFLNNQSLSLGAISMLRKLRFSMTWHAIIDKFPDITALAVRAAETVGAIGPCNVQLRRDRLNQH